MENVSVIITTYNSSSTILSAINSVLKQKNIKFEIIIVDDHSDDFEKLNAKFLNFLDGIDIKIIQPPKKGNANISRNLGIKQAKYEYIAFLDADDTWNDEHLFQGVKCLQSNNADIVFSKVKFVKDKVITLSKQPDYHGDIADYIFSTGIAVTSSLIVKKTSIEKCMFDEEQLKHQDWEFLIRAHKQGLKICQSDYIGLNYTLSTGNNMSSKFNPKATVRFLNKTLPSQYHNVMLSSQINGMVNSNDNYSLLLLRKELIFHDSNVISLENKLLLSAYPLIVKKMYLIFIRVYFFFKRNLVKKR